MNNSPRSVGVASDMDVGLRDFMTGTYKYMAVAMAISAATAYAMGIYLSNNQQLLSVFRNPMIVLAFVFSIPIGFGIIGRKLPSMSLPAVKMFLFGFAAVMGLWLAPIAYIAQNSAGMGAVTLKIFFMAIAVFGSLSVFGYVTKRDLGPIAKFCGMLFVGVIAYMLLSMFIPGMQLTGTADFIFNGVGLLAVCGITAWETQSLKRMYYSIGDSDMAEKYSVMGAASLLLSFINIFMFLFRMFASE